MQIISRFRTPPDDAARVEARLDALLAAASRPVPAVRPLSPSGWTPDDAVFADLARRDRSSLDPPPPVAEPPPRVTSRAAPSPATETTWATELPLRGDLRPLGEPAPSGEPRPVGAPVLIGEPQPLCGDLRPLGEPAPDGEPRPVGAPVLIGEPAPGPPAGRGRFARWASRWLPEGLQGAIVDPGRRPAAVLLAVVLAGGVLGAVVVARGRPAPVQVTAPPVVPASPPGASAGRTAGPGGLSPGPSASGQPIVVAVAGRVRHPGVVTLAAGARVVDAVRAAGGALPGANLGLLNLARRLADGELIAVGVPGAPTDVPVPGGSAGAAPPSSGGTAGSSGGLVDLNTATAEQLDTLPGVGPVLAQRIVEWRAAHGRFESVDQLHDVDGIGPSKFAQLRDRVTV